MSQNTQIFLCSDEDATAALAREIAASLRPGDCLLLEGSVGAGKTHFARAAILSLLTEPEDIPSPTFTLVQTYDSTNGAIWHADLYRLASDYEVEELGLAEAMDSAICLIEWPDRLGPTSPSHAAKLSFDVMDNARRITASWSDGPSAQKWARIFHKD